MQYSEKPNKSLVRMANSHRTVQALDVKKTTIEVNSMIYYVYENWTAEHKAVIHRGSCGNCNEGRGCHENPLGNIHGRWHGPFVSLEKARRVAENTGKPVREHRCV